jgi:hypothetical protein
MKANRVQWKIMNKKIMPDIPAAKNLALFSLFVCRRAFDKAALALAFTAAIAAV